MTIEDIEGFKTAWHESVLKALQVGVDVCIKHNWSACTWKNYSLTAVDRQLRSTQPMDTSGKAFCLQHQTHEQTSTGDGLSKTGYD